MSHFEFTGARILVVGDLMLDKYLSGSVERLSPEAPVPVLLRQAERAVLGGAANVCANLAALGAEVVVVGVIGQDEPGSVLVDLLKAYPAVNTDKLVIDRNRPTTCKIRVMSASIKWFGSTRNRERISLPKLKQRSFRPSSTDCRGPMSSFCRLRQRPVQRPYHPFGHRGGRGSRQGFNFYEELDAALEAEARQSV